ncbi:MAG: rRNA maturation RNase YbeY [Patescibacteria group bacterium]
MILEFNNETEEKISQKIFEDLLTRLPQVIPDISEKTVELLLTTDAHIQKLNKEFRGKDKATDVLSFSDRETSMPSENLGQIIISVDRAHDQAKELSQSLEEELRFLFTHGLLHILDYDHEEPEDEKLMLEKAYKLLGRTA